MKTLKFKTNIKCGGCIAAVTPFLNGAQGIESWEVDITKDEKPLTVTTDLDAPSVQEIVKKAGYQAEPIN